MARASSPSIHARPFAARTSAETLRCVDEQNCARLPGKRSSGARKHVDGQRKRNAMASCAVAAVVGEHRHHREDTTPARLINPQSPRHRRSRIGRALSRYNCPVAFPSYQRHFRTCPQARAICPHSCPPMPPALIRPCRTTSACQAGFLRGRMKKAGHFWKCPAS